MNNQEILKKAIEKAEKNGYKFWNVDQKYIELEENLEIWRYKNNKNYYASVYQIIFSHDFAKAFWGDKPYKIYNIQGKVEESGLTWQYHLQQMVLEENPIKYLEAFI